MKLDQLPPVRFKDLSSDERSLLPTEEQRSNFLKQGWYTSPENAIPDDLVDNALKGAELFFKGERDIELKGLEQVADDGSDQVLSNNEFTTLQKNELKSLGFYKTIVATCAKLANSKSIKLFSDSLINKSPAKNKEKGIVGWHTDKAYWPTCSSDNMMTVWIPLQDCTLEMGPVSYIDESHQWKDELALKKFYSFNNQNLGDLESYLESQKPNASLSHMTLKKGQFSVHNGHTIHCSQPNTSSKKRVALAVHLQDSTNQYQRAYKDDGSLIQIGYDFLCSKDASGHPDYSDPNWFPLLYQA